jgi:putative transcriptional regulator
MGQQKENNFMAGKLLLSMPTMSDPRFFKSVIFICTHDENGAMGLMINNPVPGLNFKDLLKQLNVEFAPTMEKKLGDIKVMGGGPVETARGFILHGTDFIQKDTIKINEKISVTGTIDAIKEIAANNGPKEMVFVLGYAGWSAGQLEDEIQNNAWLLIDTDHDLIFNTTSDEKWDKAIKKLGIDPSMLSGEAGRA